MNLLKMKVEISCNGFKAGSIYVLLDDKEKALELFKKLGKQMIPYGKVEQGSK